MQGATRALLRALEADGAGCPELGEVAALSCERLARDQANLEIMRGAGGRWLLAATATSVTYSDAARAAAQAVLEALEAAEAEGNAEE